MANLKVAQDWESKSIQVGLVITILARVWMPFLVSTMLNSRQKELNVVEKKHM
jgi:hypothetical protein